MASGPYSFIDIAVMDEVRARFAAGEALAILSIDLDEVIWANGTGAALFGHADIESVMGSPTGFALAARRQMTATPGFPRALGGRSVTIRHAAGVSGRPLTFQLNSLTLPRGEPAILIAVPAAVPEWEEDEDPAVRIIDGFEEAGYHAALLGRDANVVTASAAFFALGIAEETLRRLVDEVAVENDRLVKRPIAASHGHIPAGIARLTDDPPLNLLLVVDEVLDMDDAPEQTEADEPEAHAEAAEPSDADLAERLDEDMAAAGNPHEERPSGRADAADDWYFGPGEHEAEPAETEQPVAAAAPARPDFTGTAPLRFVWKTDAAGAISFISDAFVEQVRLAPDRLIGASFADIAEELDLDPTGEITGLLERRDTWSGRTVMWPVGGTDLLAPVDLAALPTYNRDRAFEGFRGFGVLRLAESAVAPTAPEAPAEEFEAEAEEPDEATQPIKGTDDPFNGEVPVISIAERRDRRASDKVIRLAEHRTGTTQAGRLSPGEQNAFEEIRARLKQDYNTGETDAEASADVPDAPLAEAPVAVDNDDPAQDADTPEPVDDAQSDDVIPAEPQPAASPAPATSGFVPSAFSPGGRQTNLEAELISGLPLPLLVHAGDELYFANREFLDLTGYASLAQIEREGGLGRLFVEADHGDGIGDDGRKLHIRTLGGDEFPVDAHLQSIRWNDRSALLMSLQRVAPAAPRAPEPPLAIVPAGSAELERQLAEMRTIIDTATDGVVLIEPDGSIRNISRPAEALFGFDSADVEGRPFETLFAMESRKAASDYLSGLAENGVASVLNDGREVMGREAHGRFIPLFMTIGRLMDDSGYCAVVRDITQWKRAEEELTQARSHAELASSQKTEFLARVSHEIRTPLNAIIGFSELMIDEKFGPIGSDRYRDYLRDINRSGNHVLDLVNDLLDISKIEAGEQEMNYEAVSLNDALGESVAMMQPQANRDRVIIRSSLASKLPEVVADLRSVRQIALNLLSNAIRYTMAGGQVIVSTSYEPSGDVVMRVRDTGIGMTLSEIDQALKPFKQINALKRGRHDGTGLGLPLTKAMVEANRARFTIASTPGEGTLVEIVFPSTRVLAD